MKNLFSLLLVISSAVGHSARSAEVDPQQLAVDLPEAQRNRYRNFDGSCVQCSIGMLGANQNCPAAEFLLEDSKYGKAVRGGSWYERVQKYCEQRGIRAWNVEGKETWEWMDWACDTGRGAAIGAGGNHFQTLVGRNAKTGEYYVCNNNSPKKIDVYSREQFRQLHLRAGQWCVILDYPPPPRPVVVIEWWKRPVHVQPSRPRKPQHHYW